MSSGWYCSVLFMLVEMLDILAWGTSVMAVIEAPSLWNDIQDEPALFKPPYHPDLPRGQQLAAIMVVFTLVWGSILLLSYVIVTNCKLSISFTVWVRIRTAVHVIFIACYVPAIVYQSRYLPRSPDKGCQRRHSWPPGSGVSSSVPTMFELIPGAWRRGSWWNSCERLVTLFYTEIALVGFLGLGFSLNILLAIQLFFINKRKNNEYGVESQPLQNMETSYVHAYDDERRARNRTTSDSVLVYHVFQHPVRAFGSH